MNLDVNTQTGHQQLAELSREERLYLAVVIDLYSRSVVGWAVSNWMKKDLAIRALNMAINLRKPAPGCIQHTDRVSFLL